MLRKISIWLGDDFEQSNHHADKHFKRCDHQGCPFEGLYEAPKEHVVTSKPNQPQQWYFFCKNHVREYNNQWNYYQSMTEDQAYASYKNDMTWNRPSWQIGNHPAYAAHNAQFQDPFMIFDNTNPRQSLQFLSHEAQNSLYLFNLNFPFSLEDLQIAYRKQVKKHHPDLHHTSSSEEKIRQINQAYACLKDLYQRKI